MAKYIALGLIRFYGVFLSESDFHVKCLKGLNRRQFFETRVNQSIIHCVLKTK